MKKLTLFLCVFASLLIVGCSMNYNQSASDDIIHQSALNLDKLINANFTDIEKSLGNPYSATYYIDADNLKDRNINSISVEDLKEDVSMLASYKDPKSSNSYIHIYFENGIVKDALYGPYKIDNLENIVPIANISNADYKIDFFKNNGSICYDDFSIDNAQKNFLGKSISYFNNYYDLKSANFIASTINESDLLYFYPLVDCNTTNNNVYKQHPNYSSNESVKLGLVNPLNNNISSSNRTNNNDLNSYYKESVVLYVKNNKIQSILKADKQFFYNLVTDIFTK